MMLLLNIAQGGIIKLFKVAFFRNLQSVNCDK